MNLYESLWNYSIVYECIWKRFDVYEPMWRYMKVNDRIWMWIYVVNECIRKCMKPCDGIGIYMMVYGCNCAHTNVYKSVWWYMNVNVSKWE